MENYSIFLEHWITFLEHTSKIYEYNIYPKLIKSSRILFRHNSVRIKLSNCVCDCIWAEHRRTLKRVRQCSMAAEAQPKHVVFVCCNFASVDKWDCRRVSCCASMPAAIEFFLDTASLAFIDDEIVAPDVVVDLNCLSYSRISLRHKFNLSIILVNSSNFALHSIEYFWTTDCNVLLMSTFELASDEALYIQL